MNQAIPLDVADTFPALTLNSSWQFF